jgi:hypothetical protein
MDWVAELDASELAEVAQVYDLVSAPRDLSNLPFNPPGAPPATAASTSGKVGARCSSDGDSSGSSSSSSELGEPNAEALAAAAAAAAAAVLPSQEQWAEIAEYARAFSVYDRVIAEAKRSESAKQVAAFEAAVAEVMAAAGTARHTTTSVVAAADAQQAADEQQAAAAAAAAAAAGPVGEGAESGAVEQAGSSFSARLASLHSVADSAEATPRSGVEQLTPRALHLAEGGTTLVMYMPVLGLVKSSACELCVY